MSGTSAVAAPGLSARSLAGGFVGGAAAAAPSPAAAATRHYGRLESRVHPLTLSFFDAGLEATFRLSVAQRSARRSRWASAAFLLCLVVLGAFEFAFGYSGGLKAASRLDIGLVRCATAAVPLVFALALLPLADPGHGPARAAGPGECDRAAQDRAVHGNASAGQRLGA